MWYFEEGKHGGTINDIAIHGIDLLRFITGKEFTKVNFAKTWNAFADKEPEFKESEFKESSLIPLKSQNT